MCVWKSVEWNWSRIVVIRLKPTHYLIAVDKNHMNTNGEETHRHCRRRRRRRRPRRARTFSKTFFFLYDRAIDGGGGEMGGFHHHHPPPTYPMLNCITTEHYTVYN